jgi:hypothetical protein
MLTSCAVEVGIGFNFFSRLFYGFSGSILVFYGYFSPIIFDFWGFYALVNTISL